MALLKSINWKVEDEMHDVCVGISVVATNFNILNGDFSTVSPMAYKCTTELW